MTIPTPEEMREDAAKRAHLQEVADMVVKVMLADRNVGSETAILRAKEIVEARNRVLSVQHGGHLPPQRQPARVGELGPTTYSPALGQANYTLPSEE